MLFKIIKNSLLVLTFIGQIHLWTLYTNDVFPTEKELSIEITFFLFILVIISNFIKNNYKIRIKKYLRLLLLFSILGVLIGSIINFIQSYNNQRTAQQLINYLEKYKATNGQYPTGLSQLNSTIKNYTQAQYGLTTIEIGYTAVQDSYQEYYLFLTLPNRKFKRYLSSDKAWTIENEKPH